MSIIKMRQSPKSPLEFSSAGSDSITPARPPVSTPQVPATKAFITIEEHLRFLDQNISHLQNLISEMIAEDTYSYEDMRDYVAELRHSRESRNEIIHLTRELSRLQIAEEQPRDYGQWIPWAYEKTRSVAAKEPAEQEQDYRGAWRWAEAEEASRETMRLSLGLKSPRKERRKSQARNWLLRIIFRRFSCVISLGRKRRR